MKSLRFLTLAVLVMLSTAMYSQTPSTLSLQGVLREVSGVAVADGQQAMTFKIYDAATGGNMLWSETQTITVTNGVYSAQLGASTALNINFSQQYYVGVTVGGTELTPRMVLTAAPYAMGLRGSSNVFGGGGNVGIGTLTPDASKKLHVVGDELVTGNVAAGSVTTTGSVAAGSITTTGSIATGAITATGNITATGTITSGSAKLTIGGSPKGIRIYAASGQLSYYNGSLGKYYEAYSDTGMTFDYLSTGNFYLYLPVGVDLVNNFISATITPYLNGGYAYKFSCNIDASNPRRLIIQAVDGTNNLTTSTALNVMVLVKTN